MGWRPRGCNCILYNMFVKKGSGAPGSHGIPTGPHTDQGEASKSVGSTDSQPTPDEQTQGVCQPIVAIKAAPWSSQRLSWLFVMSIQLSHCSLRLPSSTDMQPQAYLQLAWWRENLRVAWLRTAPRGRSLGSTGWRSQFPPQRSCRRAPETRWGQKTETTHNSAATHREGQIRKDQGV